MYKHKINADDETGVVSYFVHNLNVSLGNISSVESIDQGTISAENVPRGDVFWWGTIWNTTPGLVLPCGPFQPQQTLWSDYSE